MKNQSRFSETHELLDNMRHLLARVEKGASINVAAAGLLQRSIHAAKEELAKVEDLLNQL